MSKPTRIGSVVLEYLTRNTKHDVIPAGYYSRDQVVKLTGFTARRFITFLRKANNLKMVDTKWFKVANGMRCNRKVYYKFSPELSKLMGLASR